MKAVVFHSAERPIVVEDVAVKGGRRKEEKKRRLHVIEDLQEGISQRINSGFVGQTVEILVERQDKGKWMGRTRGDKIVFFEASGAWLGRLANVRIDKAGPWSLQGRISQ